MRDNTTLYNNVLEKLHLSSDKKNELLDDFNKFGFTERMRHKLIALLDREMENSQKNISQLKSRLDSLRT